MNGKATIPDASAFQSAAVTGSLNLMTIVNAGDYIIGYNQTSPSQLVRFTKSNLATQSVFTFPADGKHIHATGIYYRASTRKVYVTFFNPGRLLISEVDTTVTPMTSTDVLDRALTGSMAPTWIEGDETNLYVLSRNSGVGGLFSKVALSGFAETTLNLPTYFLGGAFCISGGHSYAVGTTVVDGTGLLLLKISNTTPAISSTGSFPPALASSDMALDIMASSSEIWVSFRDQPTAVYKFNSSLAMTTVATAADGDHSGFGYDGTYFWQLFTSGLAMRLNPLDTADTRRYALDSGYMTELIAYGGYLYVMQSDGIARYSTVPQVESGYAKSGTRFGGTIYSDSAQILSVARYQDGAIAIAGRFNGNINFAGTIISNPTSAVAVFIAVLNGDGTLRWVRSLASGAPNRVNSIAFDSSGNVIGCGSFQNSINLGNGVRTGSGLEIWVAKYSAADGSYIWGSTYGGPNSSEANSLAITPAGDPVVTGYFQTSMIVGSDTLISAGSTEGFLIKLSGTDGTPLFAKSFGGTGDDRGVAVVIGPPGKIILLGHFSGVANFSGTSKTASGGQDMFIARYDDDGTLSDVHTWGGTGYIFPRAIAVNASEIAATGLYSNGTADFGGATLPATPTAAIFVVKLDSGVSHLWSHSHGGGNSSSEASFGVAIDTAGVVYACGNARYYLGFNIEFDYDASDIDPFVAKLASSDGSLIWGRRYHAPSESDTANCIIVNEDEGEVIMGGQYGDAINFTPGFGVLRGNGYTDAYLVRIAK